MIIEIALTVKVENEYELWIQILFVSFFQFNFDEVSKYCKAALYDVLMNPHS